MNPYLSGIMALSQLSPEQFDMGMQRFQQVQGMQPQGLSALQARQAGLTAGIPQGPYSFPPQQRNNSYPNIPAGFTAGVSTGNSTYYSNPQTGESFSVSGQMSGNPTMSEIQPAPEGFQPPPPQPLNEKQIRLSRLQNGTTQGPATGITQGPYSQPTMSPFSNVQGSFGTGAMPYTQPYYQRSFNPYSGGFGMGQPMSGGGKGGGSPYGGSYGRPSPYSSGYGMGFQQQPSTSPMGGGKGGGMPAYGGGYGGKGGRR